MEDHHADDPLHVVLGAGPLGLAVVRALREREGRVRVVNRGSPVAVAGDVEHATGDLADPEQAVELCAGASVVHFCAQPPYTDWPAAFPPLLDGAIAGAEAADAVLVAAENCYAYGPVDGPLTEDLPADPAGPKGETRARMTETLFDAHEAGRVRATAGRASDFYGPGVTESVVGERVFEPALEGRPVYLLGDPDAPHTYTYIDDFARALVTLGGDERALGEVWHVPSAETPTTREFVELVCAVAGTRARVRTVPSWLFRVVAQLSPMLRELRETSYQFEAPFVVDHSKFATTFGADPTPHEEAVRATLDWYRERA
jgi:nucleoside-diphosphate-sugar epimerase